LTSIEPEIVALIGAVTRRAAANSIEFLVIGAFARDIWLRHCLGIAPKRKTADVDLAVLVSDWEEYELFRTSLLQAESFRECGAPNHPERLLSPKGVVLDLLPFGGVTESRERDLVIRWPCDGAEMSVLGFREAWETAASFTVPHHAGEYEVRVLTPPSLAVLKLVAWSDRRHSVLRRKHVEDLYLILESYPAMNLSKADDVDDWADMPTDEIEIAAYLLGQDVRAVAAPDAVQVLDELLEHEVTSASTCALARDVQRHCGGSFPKARSILSWLNKGLGDGREGRQSRPAGG